MKNTYLGLARIAAWIRPCTSLWQKWGQSRPLWRSDVHTLREVRIYIAVPQGHAFSRDWSRLLRKSDCAHPYIKHGASPGLSGDPTFTPSVVNKMIKVPRRDTHSSVSQTTIQKVANSNTKTAKTWQKRDKLRYKNSKNRANRYTKMCQKAIQEQRYETGDTATAITNKMIQLPHRDTHSPDSQTAIQKWQTEIQKRLKRGKLRCKNSASGANRCTKMRQKAVQGQRYETGDTTNSDTETATT